MTVSSLQYNNLHRLILISVETLKLSAGSTFGENSMRPASTAVTLDRVFYINTVTKSGYTQLTHA